MDEQTLIIRIAHLKNLLCYSMIEHLPKSDVMEVLDSCTKRRVGGWFSDLHRREVDRRVILKGLILPGSHLKVQPSPESFAKADKPAPEIPVSIEDVSVSAPGVTLQHKDTESLIQELRFDEPNNTTVPEASKEDEVQDNLTAQEASLEGIPLITPIKPRRRATQKKMLRARGVQQEEEKIESRPLIPLVADEGESKEVEASQEKIPQENDSFSVIQDPELQLKPKVLPQEVQQEDEGISLEELCDALDEDPEDFALLMKRGAYYEEREKFVFALSDYRKAAEKTHQPAWDAYIQLLLKCNLKVRAAEAESQRSQ